MMRLQERIVELVNWNGGMTTAELAKELSVTEPLIRSEVSKLAESERIESDGTRITGGAR